MKRFTRLLLFLVSIGLLAGCGIKADISNDNSYLKSFLSNSEKAVILKFHAPWCSTCKQYSPEFEKAKTEFSEKIDFFEVDVDQKENQKIIKELKISRIPDTIFISKDRMQVSRKAGPLSYEDLQNMAKELIYADESK